MFEGDVTSAPLLPTAGRIAVRRVNVSPSLVGRFGAPPERAAWWRARLERVYALLADA
jgi:O-succinylbenzoate synthase